VSHSNSKTVIIPTRERGEPIVGPDAIMVSIASELEVMVDLSCAEKVTLKTLSPFEFFLVKRVHTSPLVLAGPLLGAPQSVLVLEKLIALGVRRIWVLGWAGSLQANLLIGDLIIPTVGLSEEGTSDHYPIDKKTARTSSLLNERLDDALRRAGLPFAEGPVWTTDAIYRETVEKVSTYGGRGVLAVEMEMSALITVARYRSVELAGLLVVSDQLFSLEWHSGFKSDTLRKRSREACQVLLDLCMVRDERKGKDKNPNLCLSNTDSRD